MQAVDLARELGVDPKRLRQWLRDNFPHERNTRWDLTQEEERRARERFAARSNGAPVTKSHRPSGTSIRSNSDESYVIDLCDEVLGVRASRQHRFPWLVGDPGKSGARSALPVDAYYPQRALVVEYKERQHSEATPFFDRRQTVSGVGRREQRRRYDERREIELPRHGIRLFVIRSTDLHADNRGRLLRSRVADMESLAKLLLAAGH